MAHNRPSSKAGTKNMIFQRPATKSGHIFDLLAKYILKDEVPDGISLARLRREASEVLRTPDVAEGHILCSGVSLLEWDLEKAAWHVAQAALLDRSVATMMNASVTFGALNRPDLAVPYALAAANLAPTSQHVINESSSTLIAVGQVSEALKLQAKCAERDPLVHFEISAADLAAAMRDVDVSEEWLAEEFAIARRVLTDARLRTRQFSYESEADPDGGPCIAFEFGFYGDLNTEFRLDDELATRLSQTTRWNPSRLSVHMKYLDAEENAVLAV